VETERVLQEKAQKLTEQEHITTEHVQTEEQLATVASTLLTTVSTTVSDLEGLHSKLGLPSFKNVFVLFLFFELTFFIVFFFFFFGTRA